MDGMYLWIDGHGGGRRRGVKPLPTRYPIGEARPIYCAIMEIVASLLIEQIFCRGEWGGDYV
jgi:hypothetical protein